MSATKLTETDARSSGPVEEGRLVQTEETDFRTSGGTGSLAAGFDPRTRGTGESQERAFGDNNDGMSLFAERGRNVLVVNNEYVNRSIIYPGGKPGTADDVRKGKAGHGVPVIEIAEQGGRWSIVRDSPCNRRITADTPMDITGPARGHDLLGTAADPASVLSLGTWNDCGNGRTPWGTYLACEENFNAISPPATPRSSPAPPSSATVSG